MLAVDSMLTNEQYGTYSKRRNFPICTLGHSRKAKVTAIVCDKAMEKLEKWLNLWIHEMISNSKKHSREAKAKEICSLRYSDLVELRRK